MPVNSMRTHGHGQGYADTNFIIPELIGIRCACRKGPYYADEGRFLFGRCVADINADRDRLRQGAIAALERSAAYGYGRVLVRGEIVRRRWAGELLLVAGEGRAHTTVRGIVNRRGSTRSTASSATARAPTDDGFSLPRRVQRLLCGNRWDVDGPDSGPRGRSGHHRPASARIDPTRRAARASRVQPVGRRWSRDDRRTACVDASKPTPDQLPRSNSTTTSRTSSTTRSTATSSSRATGAPCSPASLPATLLKGQIGTRPETNCELGTANPATTTSTMSACIKTQRAPVALETTTRSDGVQLKASVGLYGAEPAIRLDRMVRGSPSWAYAGDWYRLRRSPATIRLKIPAITGIRCSSPAPSSHVVFGPI